SIDRAVRRGAVEVLARGPGYPQPGLARFEVAAGTTVNSTALSDRAANPRAAWHGSVPPLSPPLPPRRDRARSGLAHLARKPRVGACSGCGLPCLDRRRPSSTL